MDSLDIFITDNYHSIGSFRHPYLRV